MRRAAPLLRPFAGGVLVALSLPPWGWWPLAFVGLALVAARPRAVDGLMAGIAQFGVGLAWMKEFTAPGVVLCVLLQTAFVVAALAVTPRRRWWALPAALVLAEAARGRVPLGGLPLAGIALGQAGGPLGAAARVGGQLAVVGLAAAAGVALLAATRRQWIVAAASAALVAVVPLAGFVAPDGGRSHGPVRAALVQGGGRRGFRGVDTDPADVLARHLAASARIPARRDLVLWPEDVVDVPGRLRNSDEERALGGVARNAAATLVAGVVEDVSATRFANAAVVWSPEGRVIARYDKVHRVPFGEYIPLRPLVGRLADISAVPRDALPGRGAGVVRTPAGPFGVAISYEVFFADRARAAANGGGQILLVPTNAASYRTSQVPTQEVAAARLRALETGRDVLQAAPTGYSAAVDHRGRVLARSTLGRMQVIAVTVGRRTGRTIYVRTGDGPAVLLAAVVLGAAWLGPRRRGDAGATPDDDA